MRHCGLRSIKNSFGTREVTFTCGNQRNMWDLLFKHQNPIFLLGWEEKTGILRDDCRDNGPKNICWALTLSEEVSGPRKDQ